MARINIEDGLYKDNRFYKLSFLLGSKREALGALVEAWTVAQSKVSQDNPEGVFSVDEWEAQDLAQEIITAKLATIKDGMVSMVGAKKNFAWLLQKSEAGKKSSERKLESLKAAREKRWGTKGKDQNDRSDNVNDRSTYVNTSEALTLTPSLTPSLSLDHTLDQNNIAPVPKGKDAKRKKTTPEVETDFAQACRATWESYSNAYKKRYGVDALRNAKANGQIKSFVLRIGQQESPQVAEFYLSHNSAKYISSAHSVGAMLYDAEKLRTEWLRGRQITSTHARSVENKQQNINAFSKFLQAGNE
ncbi:MAG: hypothetical protein AB7I27_00505 [Bacteriovoracaceae bacterium]